jgi:hypothetical protein
MIRSRRGVRIRLRVRLFAYVWMEPWTCEVRQREEDKKEQEEVKEIKARNRQQPGDNKQSRRRASEKRAGSN